MNQKFSIEKQPNLTRDTFWIKFIRKINYFLLVYSFKGSCRLRDLIRKFLIPQPKGAILVHTDYGFNIICMDPIGDKGVERALYLNGRYESGTLDIMRKCLKESDTFIDVGANIGIMSIFASKIVGDNGTVYAFEPEPETVMIFKKNLKINGVKNVKVQNIALGAREGSSFIYDNPYAGRGSASLIKPQGQNNFKKYKINIESLDNFILRNNISNIKMIKIDVEGAELNVLKGAKSLLQNKQAPILCVEYSKLTSTDNKLLDIYSYILSVNNYSIYKLERGKEIPSKLIKVATIADLPFHDNLFCFLPFHFKDIPRDMFA